ncbi:MAG: DUF262 domain-containing protein [Gallionella sp.]|nr:DUF262 domain-containing protein [Gallionella sp.]
MSSVIVENKLKDFFLEGFSSPKLTEWLDWSAGEDAQHFVALPMIQRGSVWKPKQIITLWDSLLRGMPIGSLMLSRLNAADKHGNAILVRRVGSTQLQPVPEGGGAALIDGQQRTLTMLLGWPHASADQKQSRTLWVDFADKPAPEHLFRMHVTSTAHPYGFTKADANAKLSLRDRREAKKSPQEGKQFPWDSHFPIRLNDLIQTYLDVDRDALRWKDAVLAQLLEAKTHRNKSWQDFEGITEKWNSLKALDRFSDCLQALFALKIPLIAIPDKCFTESDAQEGDDPALAVLFKRVGTGGTALSDADYVYSVIKHQLPETFQLVESIASNKGFSQLLGPTDIVMTAVRLVAAERGMTDFESPNKANFDSLRKDPQFLQSFLELVRSGRLSQALHTLTEGLKFNPENGTADPGLPMHGFILASRPVLQILLRWALSATKQHAVDEAQFSQVVAQSRNEMLRFVLYAHLALPDIGKASAWAFAWIKANEATGLSQFPGRQLVQHLIARGVEENREVAWPLPTKEVFQTLAISEDVEKAKPMLGWERFQAKDDAMRQAMSVFHRWWGNGNHYQHAMLLWLQRAYVDRIEKNPNEVRSDDEVPYDYDHICPSNHWGNWTGITSQDRLLNFLANDRNKGHVHVGNSIGNLRVWYASENRADGDDSAVEKLNFERGNDGRSNPLLQDSAIQPVHIEFWKVCSGKGSGIAWNAERAQAFQNAVEHRVYDLYARYFDELKFSEWFPLPVIQDVTSASA